ncbi:MAG: Trm112 family protein [Enterobacteriaceae bacterium]
MDYRLLEIIACPLCHGKLVLSQSKQELICRFEHLAYPVCNGIPVLLETEARPLSDEEKNA